MKIAILILAHQKVSQLNKLLRHLSKNFDVFVHIDKKSCIRVHDIYRSENIYVLSKFAVYWGSYNQILATVELLRYSFNLKYDRYLLLSGQDVPVVPNSRIINFFSGNTNEYLECSKLPLSFWNSGGFDRVARYHADSIRGVVGLRAKIIGWQERLFGYMNDSLKMTRRLNYEFYGGANWFNFTHDSVKRMLEYMRDHPAYLRRYKHTISADEIFFQTLIKLVNNNAAIINSSLRYIDWHSGPEYPRILRSADFNAIVDSGMLFARKIDEEVDADISAMLYQVAESQQ